MRTHDEIHLIVICCLSVILFAKWIDFYESFYEAPSLKVFAGLRRFRISGNLLQSQLEILKESHESRISIRRDLNLES